MDAVNLNVHEATVNTVTVTVKTLTIGRRQVTQAVFRQLIKEQLLDFNELLNDDPELTFRGLPWGTVNYHPDKCLNGESRMPVHVTGKHLHVVWQLGDELRRTTVFEPIKEWEWTPWSDNDHKWFDALVVGGWRMPWRTDDYNYHSSIELKVQPDLPALHLYRSRISYEARSLMYDRDDHEVCQQRILDRLNGQSEAELRAQVVRDIRSGLAKHRSAQVRWQELTALPQLFIAV